ncbi:hypothetical protein [Nonomuraea recticatena]|uniref:Uncharacterized protein n=1 Tax=Nonomuraea recticatena TaxID=46178 RepID=A0ABP6DJQ3_9ACTN
MRDDGWKRVGPAERFDLAELYDAAGLDVVVESGVLRRQPRRCAGSSRLPDGSGEDWAPLALGHIPPSQMDAAVRTRLG